MSSDRGAELHLVTRRGERRAWDHCRRRLEAGHTLEVILLHDAVLETWTSVQALVGEAGGEALSVFAGAEDARRRRVEERWPLADYAQIIASCARARQVIAW